MARIIVDENVYGTTAWELFQRRVGRECDEFVFIAKEHPGIPDVEILDKLLQAGDVLLTLDVVLHARALKSGVRAYTVNERGELTHKRLPSVGKLKPLPKSVHKELLADYRQPSHPLYSKLSAALSDKQRKRYRTLRRRINSHFGCQAAISQCSVTIGAQPLRNTTLAGHNVYLSGNSGVKGQRARESYCRFQHADGDRAAGLLLYALREVYLLRIHHVAIDLFVIPDECVQLARQMLERRTEYDCPVHEAARLLLDGLAKVSIHPCVKGRFYDAMQSKLRNLSQTRSNEITSYDCRNVAKQIVDGGHSSAAS